MAEPAWRLPAAGLLIIAGVFALGLAGGMLLFDGPAGRGSTVPVSQRPDAPVRITIGQLGVDAPVRPVGLDDRGAIDAPPLDRADEAAWYVGGPAPGQDGAAVIVGHVDDADGPAVFHDLPALAPGSRVEVTRRDGDRVVFEVTAVRTYPKEHLPAEVYDAAGGPELRLITCGGEWIGGDVGYEDNIVVFATAVGADRPGAPGAADAVGVGGGGGP
ncbi:MAG TPA: class F sortase [Natronosporangium sp.]|nr:class F sortase [Natronosporangium sp.]